MLHSRVLWMSMISVLLSLLWYIVVDAQEEKQITKLTYYNLIKVRTHFPVVFVKFDENYPTDREKEIEFERLAEDLRFSQDILIGHFPVPYDLGQDNDEEDDDEDEDDNPKKTKERLLAESLNATGNYPIYFLYRKGNEKPIRYTDEKMDSQTLRDFIRSNVPNLIITLEHCIPELDRMVREFIPSKSDQRQILYQGLTKIIEKKLTGDQQKSGKIYQKIMQRILERGDIFIESENARLANLLSGAKLSDSKKQDLKIRRNILESFRVVPVSGRAKEEL